MLLRPVTVKARLTLAVAGVVVLAVALAGLVIVVRVDRGERATVDAALAARASEVSAVAVTSGSLPTDGTFVVRLVDGGRVSAQKGATVQFSVPVDDGYSTVTAADGSHWRSLAQALKSGAQLQVLISLAAVESRHSRNIRTVNVAVLLAALIAAAGARIAAELALRGRPTELADPDNGDVAGDAEAGPTVPSDGDALPDSTALSGDAAPRSGAPGGAGSGGAGSGGGVGSGGVGERPDVDRAAVVEFFRDPVVALGTGLETLLDNPDMSSTQRHLVLAAVQTEHRRLIELLDALVEPERHA